MSQEMQRLFDERLARYQATIAREPTDRMVVAGTGSNYFTEAYAGYSFEEITYRDDKWLAAFTKFAEDFPEVELLRASVRQWPPLFDAVGYKLYKLPGRDLPPDTPFQYFEGEWMKPEDYDLLIRDMGQFLMERFLPRVMSEFAERGSTRSYLAFLKGGLAMAMRDHLNGRYGELMRTRYGLPPPVQSSAWAPFDALADKLRGLQGIMIDIHERPDKVLAACEAIIPDMANSALAAADPLRRYPVLMPLHRGCHPFLSPRQFDTFYWPSLKKLTNILLDAGHTLRVYLEGDWTSNWHHYNEFPKGKIICDIDNKADIARAKREIGDTVCLAGGIPDSMFILGKPDQIRARVKELCETVGKDGGLIIGGGCAIPYGAKPENFRAYTAAILEYGRYSDTIKPKLKPAPQVGFPTPKGLEKVMTPWEVVLKDLGGVMGDEALVRDSWEMMEKIAYRWLLSWAW
ncbi:MAG: uroporphyrinogen decarboxylase family protein [Chloroflexota bacterium]|nr:uroporphyrinogen decarboxylase family protein [Chloroflexota bacterium]